MKVGYICLEKLYDFVFHMEIALWRSVIKIELRLEYIDRMRYFLFHE